MARSNTKKKIFDDPLMSERLSYVPGHLLRSMGCSHCEWRSTDFCPCLFKLDSCETEFREPDDGICDDRKLWILSLVPDYDSKPSISRFMNDFNLSLGNKIMLSEFHQMNLLHARLLRKGVINVKGSEVLLKHLMRLRSNWQQIWNKVQENYNQQLNREEPRKHEHTLTKISPRDITELLQNHNKSLKSEPRV